MSRIKSIETWRIRVNETPNNPMPPQQPGAGSATHQPPGQQGSPYHGAYQEPYPGGYGFPPAPGYNQTWAQPGYQDRYKGGYGHPPAPGNNPPWAHQDHHRGGHHAYYGAPAPTGYYAQYGTHHCCHTQPNSAPPQGHYVPHHHHDGGLGSFFNFRDERFVKGAITGATLTFLLTNDAVQKNAIRSLVKIWSMFQGGIEEVKERFKDAEAEIKTEASSK